MLFGDFFNLLFPGFVAAKLDVAFGVWAIVVCSAELGNAEGNQTAGPASESMNLNSQYQSYQVWK